MYSHSKIEAEECFQISEMPNLTSTTDPALYFCFLVCTVSFFVFTCLNTPLLTLKAWPSIATHGFITTASYKKDDVRT